ncbi:hypothetical protein ACFRR7_06110 [Streptomyces sp. NPDC056909]|uniref:hypothetical protein n=1 Tax=unclassified Streptomyces TaxID=2593676 RepID=UPI00342450D2|nr:hypothetical protein OG214_02875 [Streptomyces sp. NBC_00872]
MAENTEPTNESTEPAEAEVEAHAESPLELQELDGAVPGKDLEQPGTSNISVALC